MLPSKVINEFSSMILSFFSLSILASYVFSYFLFPLRLSSLAFQKALYHCSQDLQNVKNTVI